MKKNAMLDTYINFFDFRTQRHPVTKLFTFSLILEFVALCFNVVHAVKYAADGVGFAGLAVAGDILDIMSRVSHNFYFSILYDRCNIKNQLYYPFDHKA